MLDDSNHRWEKVEDAAVCVQLIAMRLIGWEWGEREGTQWSESAAQKTESLLGSFLRPGPGDLTVRSPVFGATSEPQKMSVLWAAFSGTSHGTQTGVRELAPTAIAVERRRMG